MKLSRHMRVKGFKYHRSVKQYLYPKESPEVELNFMFHMKWIPIDFAPSQWICKCRRGSVPPSTCSKEIHKSNFNHTKFAFSLVSSLLFFYSFLFIPQTPYHTQFRMLPKVNYLFLRCHKSSATKNTNAKQLRRLMKNNNDCGIMHTVTPIISNIDDMSNNQNLQVM